MSPAVPLQRRINEPGQAPVSLIRVCITTDGVRGITLSIMGVGAVRLRTNRYLNNRIEQDHRGIKISADARFQKRRVRCQILSRVLRISHIRRSDWATTRSSF
jgi:transposase-like protein